MGFRGKCHAVLKSYSTEREERTNANYIISEERSVIAGLAQGSVLGPFEYLLYVQRLKFAGLKTKYLIIFSGMSDQELEERIL